MYKDLRQLRLQVDQLKRKILVEDVKTTDDDQMLKRLFDYMNEIKLRDLDEKKRAQ